MPIKMPFLTFPDARRTPLNRLAIISCCEGSLGEEVWEPPLGGRWANFKKESYYARL